MPELTHSVAGIRYNSMQNAGTQYRELSIPMYQMGQAVGIALMLSNIKGLPSFAWYFVIIGEPRYLEIEYPDSESTISNK